MKRLEIVQVRISVSRHEADLLVRVDGWLAGDGVAELERVLACAASPVCLLVHELRGADAAGLSLLRRLAAMGAPLEGLSTYIQLLLADRASAETSASREVAGSETPVRRNHT